MERNELRRYIKEQFRARGFQAVKSMHYKIFNDDYLVGFELDPSSYVKGYYFRCGMIYLPDNNKMPFRGAFDLHWDFIFPWEPGDDPDIQSCIDRKLYRRTFEYTKYSVEQLDEIFQANYTYFIEPLLDPEFGLNIYRSDWRHMKYCSNPKIEMLCKRANLDTSEVLRFLGKTETDE